MFDKGIQLDEAFEVLTVEKLLYDYTGKVIGNPLDESFVCDTIYEAFNMLCDIMDAGYVKNTDIYVSHISFLDMKYFYEMCREHSKQNRIKFKKNPYVKAACEFVNEEMRSIDSYDFDWILAAPIKETGKKRCSLIIFEGPEFHLDVSWIEILCNIREYYYYAAKRLEKELYGDKKKTLNLLSLLPSEERKAA